MSHGWNCYRIDFVAKSDLCIGFHKLGFVQRTRYFIPPRNLWAVATAAHARRTAVQGEMPAYADAGGKIDAQMRFSGLFVVDGERLLYPWLAPGAFEAAHVGSRGRAAIRPDTATALDGALFDMEFLSMCADGRPVHFRGYVWATPPWDTAALTCLLSRIEVGGERRYGMGVLQLCEPIAAWLEPVFGFPSRTEGDNPTVQVGKDLPVPAHLRTKGCPEDLTVTGGLEPLTGRNTSNRGAGQDPQPMTFCWAPDARLSRDTELEIGSQGIWQFPERN